MTSDEKKQSYTDNKDRIEVERGFSLAKICYGLGLLYTKLNITTHSSIALSIIAMNVNRLTCIILRCVMISIELEPLRVPKEVASILNKLYGDYENVPPLESRIQEVTSHYDTLKRFAKLK